jgi:exopolyphosphatase / guanosine-5'-triphosphate,3'-diphosphate pyrophosphatase
VGRNVSAKVRGGLMDVKRLEAVNDDGLEQWRPVLKAPFPLPESSVEALLAELRAPAVPLTRGEYTVDALVEEVVSPIPELRAVEVHKRRRHFTVGACLAELSDLVTDGGAQTTIAVESEDPALVSQVVRELGLDSRPNVSVPRVLQRLVGLGARYAVVDVGTNSVKFVVAERSAEGTWRTVVERAEVTRLGEGLDRGGRLQSEPIERTVEAIEAMADEAAREGVVEIAAVGTAGLRIASNGDGFVEAVRERTGIEVEIISGDEEGRLAYVAVVSALPGEAGSLVVFDTGGGSSQFTFGQGGKVDERFSLDVGAVRFTERFGLDGVVSETTLASALDAISADLERLDSRPAPDALVGIGGAVTNLAAVELGLEAYDPDVIRGTVLDRSEIDRQIELYRARTADERREIIGLQPKRAEVILAGVCIVRTVLAKLGRDSLTVSDRGLRHGLLEERFGAR